MRETVLLVPGLGLGGFEMTLLAVRLRRRGYAAGVFRHCPWRHSLSEKAALLQAFAADRGGDVVHFVGHSFGGLLVLRLFADYPAQAPGRIVMLGSPVCGSKAARCVAGWPLGRRLLGGYVGDDCAEALLPLPEGREVGGIAGKVNIVVGSLLGLGRPNDTLVSAEEALRAEMTDTALLPVSHSSMLLSRRVAGCVDSFLQTGQF